MGKECQYQSLYACLHALLLQVGPKTVPASYAEIVLTLGVDSPSRVLFLTDALAEAAAAAAAGLQVAVTDRPGNSPLPPGHGFAVISSLADVSLA